MSPADFSRVPHLVGASSCSILSILSNRNRSLSEQAWQHILISWLLLSQATNCVSTNLQILELPSVLLVLVPPATAPTDPHSLCPTANVLKKGDVGFQNHRSLTIRFHGLSVKMTQNIEHGCNVRLILPLEDCCKFNEEVLICTSAVRERDGEIEADCFSVNTGDWIPLLWIMQFSLVCIPLQTQTLYAGWDAYYAKSLMLVPSYTLKSG